MTYRPLGESGLIVSALERFAAERGVGILDVAISGLAPSPRSRQ
jgi:hypothetical protein